MENFFTLSKENPTRRIKVRKEQPFFEITKIVLPDDQELLTHQNAVLPVFTYEIKNKNKVTSDFIHFSKANRVAPFSRELILEKVLINKSESEYDTIEFSCDFNRFSFLSSFEIYYSLLPQLISLDTLFDDFSEHFNDSGNCKILFSAPFGQGKTTFLKEYFNNYSQQYEVFHLFPVNYSVASNEDIFRYIKCELLFQLFERNVKFDETKFSSIDVLPGFLMKDPAQALIPIIKLLPKTERTIAEFALNFVKVFQNFKEYKNEIQVDDLAAAEKYTRIFYEQEGSIYEDNFYTQLIKQLVEQLHEQGKTTVFIIDDLDRMDPEHIFRIMNVLAAHFDGPEYQMNHHSNKFGFDKIILVADYENLKKIFCHKYGHKTAYEGYLDKFYSKRVCYFDSKKLLLASLNSYKQFINKNVMLNRMVTILSDLIITNNISLRKLLMLNKIPMLFYSINDSIIINGNEDSKTKLNKILGSVYYSYNYFLQLHYLSQISGVDSVIEMLQNCATNISTDENVKISSSLDTYQIMAYECMIALCSNNELNENSIIEFKFKEIDHKFNIQRSNFASSFYTISNESILKSKKFNAKEFYELLSLVAIKFKEVGGIYGEKALVL